MKAHLAIISARRPQAPLEMDPFIGDLAATWYVAQGEAADYEYGGAERIVEAGDLISARNRALDDAFARDLPCVQLSDDLTDLRSLRAHGRISIATAVGQMLESVAFRDVRLAGVAPTANAFFGSLKARKDGFIVGDFFLMLPTDLRFDPQFLLKEDYDMTCQHLARYGEVVRLDWILAEFQHRSNAGGVKIYRTPEVEQAAIQMLKAKWPGAFRDNPKRPDEVLFKWRAPQPEGMFA